MSMPLDQGWHVRVVRVVRNKLGDLMVRAAGQSNVWVPVHYRKLERKWAPFPEDAC